MGQRIGLFFVTNLLFVVTISAISSIFGVQHYLDSHGLNLTVLVSVCLVWGFGASFLSLALSRFIAKKWLGVKVVSLTDENNLRWIAVLVNELAMRAGIPTPEVGVYRSDEVNAFATGPTKHRSLVAFSTALLQKMDRRAIEGVAAHELAHIKNGDMVTMTLLQGLVNAFVMFLSRLVAYLVSSFINKDRAQAIANYWLTFLFDIVFGVLGLLVTSWFSRQREYRADLGSAMLNGKDSMVQALKQLAQIKADENEIGLPDQVAALGISNKGNGGIWRLLSTHPPIEDRIARLG